MPTSESPDTPDHLPRRVLLRTLVALLAATLLAVGLQAHERAVVGTDLYPYAVARSGTSAACEYRYIEMGPAGRTLTLTAAPGADADDGGARIALRRPFELYQSAHDSLVVSGNGYLAGADGLDDDDGSDFSNDCPLPRAPDRPAASPERIYVYHDDLRPRREGGQVRHAFFRVCPRPGLGGGGEPCTVIEWNGFERSGPLLSTQPLRAQAVLYHDTRQVALQYASVDDSHGATATVGLQGLGGRTASTAACNDADAVRPQRAVCFFDPRHPPPTR